MRHDPPEVFCFRYIKGVARRPAPLFLPLLCAVCVVCVFAQPAGSLALGRRYTRAFYDGEFEQLWALMSDGLRKEQGSINNLSDFRRSVQDLVGRERRVLNEKVVAEGGQEVYVRRVMYERSAEPFDLKWVLGARGRIMDFSIRPSLPATQFKYRARARLSLPFEGEWYVASGGRTPEQNGNHYYDYLLRFANDFVRVEDTRFDRDANPPRNEDFAAFGRPILAPGAGKVALIRDGIPDNTPGRPNLNPRERVGNYVVIDHGSGEYSLLAHLKDGSVKVRAGEWVKAGQAVGACGNSGNSTGPHLHYGLHRAADPYKGMSVPAQFVHYIADGKLVERGEPLRGQKVKAVNIK